MNTLKLILYIVFVWSFLFFNLGIVYSETKNDSKINLNQNSEETIESFYWSKSELENELFTIDKKTNPGKQICYNDLKDSSKNSTKKNIRTKINNKKNKKIIVSKKYKKVNTSKTKPLKKDIKYKIKRGDTLYSISKKFGISVKSICLLNKIKNSSSVKAGRIILISSSHKSYAVSKTFKKNQKVSKISKKKYKCNFNWPMANIKSVHKDGKDGVKSIGIYIKSRPGQPVRSAANGIVKKIGYMRGYGNYVVIKHSNSFITVYSNLDSVNVIEGDNVSERRVIGSLDMMHDLLHFQMNRGGKVQDPLRFLPARG